jgi:hypothetical protein
MMTTATPRRFKEDKMETQKAKIFNYIFRKGFRGATPMELINECNAPNYRARISELRDMGFTIYCFTPKELSEHGINGKCNRYFIKPFEPR